MNELLHAADAAGALVVVDAGGAVKGAVDSLLTVDADGATKDSVDEIGIGRGQTGRLRYLTLDLEGHVRVQSEDGGQGRGEHVRGKRGDQLRGAGERGTATGDPAPEDGGVDE